MIKLTCKFVSILIFVCGFGIAAAEQVILTPVVQGSASDNYPQDGVFDAFQEPPNDRQLNNNGGADTRFSFEFDMSVVPVGAEILSAEVQVCISNWEGSRDVELHGYGGNGTLELDDYGHNGLIGSRTLEPTGAQVISFDVFDSFGRISRNSAGFSGYNLRDVFTAGRPNYLVMAVEKLCHLFPDSPRLVIDYSTHGGVLHSVHAGGPDACSALGLAPGCDANFSLVATQFADGRVKGQYIDRFAGGNGIQGKIDCLFVSGNDAWVSGTLTKPRRAAGVPFSARVQDNGTSDSDSPDQISFSRVGRYATLCTNMDAYPVFPMQQGQVTIR